MPVYRQDRNYEEEMAEEPVVEEKEEEKEEKEEQSEESEEEESEEEDKPKQKKPKKKKTKRNTKMIVALSLGSTALLVLVGVAAIGIKTKQDEAASRKAQKEAFEQMIAESEAYANTGETISNDPDAEEDTQPEVTSSVSYSDQELKALRKWGYTASEIEVASQQGLSAKELADSAREDREEAQKEALAAVSDTASDEYKNLLYSTWLGGEDLDVSAFTNDYIYTSTSRVENVDYEKCAAKNEQCFIRLNLDNGKPAFMYITPDRYNELPDTGNMVVEITTVQSGDIEVITDIVEQRVN